MEISIVMPVYNCQEHLEEAIDSVLSQTFSDFEFLIIDDGSTDNTVERILKYSDPRIRLLLNKHDFINSLNKGIDEAQGKYIARMDSDDIMKPERLYVQYQTMESHPDISVCASWICLIGQEDKEIRSFSGYIPNPLVYMLNTNIVAHPTVMLRKSFLQSFKLHYEPYLYAEDYKLWTRIAEYGGRFWVEPAFLLDYRVSENQISRQKNKEQQETTLLIRSEVLDYLIKNTPREKENIETLSQLIYDFNDKELLSEEICFKLFFDLFFRVYNSI